MTSSTISPRIQSAIGKKSAGAVSLDLAWKHAVSLLQTQGAGEEEILLWLDGFSAPKSMDALARQARRAGESIPGFARELEQRIDETDFSREDWMAAIEEVLLFLGKNGRFAAPSTLIGYVHCTAEFVASESRDRSLREQVAEMLARYGFDG